MKKLIGRLLFATTALAASSAMAAVTFFEGPGFRGEPLTVQGGVPDFRAYNYNDRAMSLVVEGAPVEVCEHVNFGGNCQVFNAGQYPYLGIWSHTISSVRPAYARHGHYGHRSDFGGYDRGPYRRDDYGQWGQERRYEPRYRYGGF